MVGGKGWENNGFLDSLGGDADDREQAQESYQEFHESRQAFLQRQEERLNTPQGQRFMKQQQQQQQQLGGDDFGNETEDDEFDSIGVSSGGSRFRTMMQKSSRMQKSRMMQQQPGGPNVFVDPVTGLEQKLAVPLDQCDEDENDSNIAD